MLWLEPCSTMGAFHHSASTGHWPTVNSMLLTLPTQWMNNPSMKCRHGVRAGFHMVVFATGVNQEKWEIEESKIANINGGKLLPTPSSSCKSYWTE